MAEQPSPGDAVVQELVHFLTSHEARTDELQAGYRQLAKRLPTPDLRYLARLVLLDEEHHHQIFEDLGETVSAFSGLKAPGMPIPPISGIADGDTREEALESLDLFIEREEQERADLERLARVLEPSGDTTLWPQLAQLMRADTERRLELLTFMRSRLLGPAVDPRSR